MPDVDFEQRLLADLPVSELMTEGKYLGSVMTTRVPSRGRPCWHRLLVASCCVLLVSGSVPRASTAQDQEDSATAETSKIPNDQLDSLVAPIALYPDPLLAQVLAASTYPLEIIQLQQWLAKNKGLSGKALADAAMKENWDPSVQALASLPDVAKRLADDIKWTTDLGNAFLAQQSDVMDAVQRMRAKAQGTGNLKSTEQQKVQTEVVDNKSVIVIQPSSPEVVYAPSYNPTVVYGPPVYPYPPIYYPPPGYYAAGMAISFGVGMAMGAAFGGGWGWGCGWGGNNNVTINNNNNFVRNSNRQSINSNRQNVGNRTGGNTWNHNPQHRGGAPYSNRSTANKYGGSFQGQSLNSRQANDRQNRLQSGQRQGADRAGQGQGQRSLGDQAGRGERARGDGGRGGTSADRVGDRSVSSGSNSRSGAFGSGGASGSSARATSARGSSSMAGGGRSRGGGGGGRRR